MDPVFARVGKICRSFPESSEQESWGNVTYRVGRRIFVWTMAMEDPQGDPIRFITVKAASGEHESLVAEGHPFFAPRSSFAKGWVGIILDGSTDWGELSELIEDSFREIAPKRAIAELDR